MSEREKEGASVRLDCGKKKEAMMKSFLGCMRGHPRRGIEKKGGGCKILSASSMYRGRGVCGERSEKMFNSMSKKPRGPNLKSALKKRGKESCASSDLSVWEEAKGDSPF